MNRKLLKLLSTISCCFMLLLGTNLTAQVFCGHNYKGTIPGDGKDCVYYLNLQDSAADGWDAASVDVSVSQDDATNYKVTTDSACVVIPIYVNDGEFIDLTYWNGANELEHSMALYDALGNLATDVNGNAVDFTGNIPASVQLRVKATCPTSCDEAGEDFTVRITMGLNPDEQSFEIYEGAASTTTQGPQVIGVNATAFAGLAPGTVQEYAVSLDKCETYTFVAFDGANNAWETGTWEIITSNPNYGTQNPVTKEYLLLASDAAVFLADEERAGFTIPCQNCVAEPIDVFGADVNCDWTGTVQVNEPFVCYPNCDHALCGITEEIILLQDGAVFTPATPVLAPTAYTDGIGDVNLTAIPVGCYQLVHQSTYCDGIITKCTTDLNIVRDVNPTLACNDNVIISLGVPSSAALAECSVEVTPDMVLEMPNACQDEYVVTVIAEDGTSLGNTVGPNQLMQTLTYVVEHKFSKNKCWGTLTIEDKKDPVIVCFDYDVPCTHPNALDENYSHTDVYEAAAEIPANIAGGVLGVVSNTFIPVNIPCSPEGELITNIAVNVTVDHSDRADLTVVLHPPSALGGPITLGAVKSESNVYTPVATSVPALATLLNQACSLTESTSPEYFVTETSNGEVPTNVGGTWYIQIIDADATAGSSFGGGQVTAASIDLTCGFAFPYAAYDCSLEGVELISEKVEETHCDQSSWNGSQIVRVWQASDKYGRTTICTQTVGLKAPTMDEISRPTDASVECSGQTADQITPAITGGPTYGCNELTEDLHGLCDISYTYADVVLPTCGKGYKIIRTWTIINWCSGVNQEHQQIIKVEDTVGPAINAANIIAGTDTYDCEATIIFNGIATDACSDVSSITVTYSTGGGAYAGSATLNIVDVTNGGEISGLPLGATELLIKAKDGCLNQTEELISITIEDTTSPIAICNDHFNVSLGSDGSAWIYAEDIDEGSFDNCGIAAIEVRRVGGCLGDTEWANAAPVECCDIATGATIELRVTDNAGNQNVCWQTVTVEDALAPVITCVPDKTITCDDPAVHAPFSGGPTAIDNCTVDLTYVDGGELDQCKAGTLTRTWTATDGSDKSVDATCVERITVEHVSDFVIQFPADVTLTNCAIQDTGAPTISDDDCELLAINHDDVILTIVEDACYKIERTWTVINWCIYDQGNAANTDLGFPQPLPRTYQDDDGYFTYVQVIKVLDADAPIISCPGDQSFCDYTDGCEGQADLTIEATDACSPDALEYTYKIDAFNDGSFDIVAQGDDASGVYPYGTHLIKWIIEDGCGNTSECAYLFTIEDCKNPTPVCLNGISIENMQTGCVDIWANDLLEYAFDNCTADEFVEGSVKMRREGSSDPLTTAMTLCCDEVGFVFVEIWVQDEAGNADYCTTYIDVQDNLNNCESDLSKASIAGHIETEAGEMVEEVTVELTGGMNTNYTTDANGAYAFGNLNTNTAYTATPTKDLNPLNGVSTYDLVLMSQHVLGVNDLDSPYAMIAADVNNDGNITTFDIVQTRQLILYVITDFPTNTSWRFVDKHFAFPSATNPWMTTFPETVNVSALTQDELAMDFVAVKVGDVNGDATPNSLVTTEERNLTGTLVLNIDDATLTTGNTTSIDFRASDFDAVNGYQFTMNFDAAAMNFTGVEAGALNVSEGNFGLAMLNEGVITTSWNGEATNVAKDAVLFTLNFDITSDVVLSQAVNVNSRYTSAEAYAGTDLMDVAFAFNTTGVVASTFELYQNTPNPFNGETVIGFTLPTAGTATLKIYDVAGKTLKVVEGDYAKGYNQISLNSANLDATGVLYYQLDTPTNSATMKMIILD